MWMALPSAKLSENCPFVIVIVRFSPTTTAVPLVMPASVKVSGAVLAPFTVLPANT